MSDLNISLGFKCAECGGFWTFSPALMPIEADEDDPRRGLSGYRVEIAFRINGPDTTVAACAACAPLAGQYIPVSQLTWAPSMRAKRGQQTAHNIKPRKNIK